MKLENIKAALKARANFLKLNPQVSVSPIVIDAIEVPDKLVISTLAKPVVADPPAVKASTPPKNSASKTKPSPQIPLLMTAAQIQPVDIGSKDKAGDKITPPVTAAISPRADGSKAPAEKAASKPATRKTKESHMPVVSAPAVPLNDIEAVVAKYLKAGRDYDRLPNTAKPTLLKSGAEILAGVFGFRTTAKVINRIESYDKQFVLYEVPQKRLRDHSQHSAQNRQKACIRRRCLDGNPRQQGFHARH